MKKAILWTVLGAAVVLGVVGVGVGVAQAQQTGRGGAVGDDDEGDGPRGRMLRRLQEELGLTDDQIEQAIELHRTFRDQTEDLREQVRAKLREATELFQGSSLRREDLLAKHREIHELTGRIAEKRIDMIYGMWQLLTPEQRQEIGDRIDDRLEDGGMGGFFGFGRGGGRHGRHGGAF
jgi:Spy/CpxP family protein refolding chaperone